MENSEANSLGVFPRLLSRGGSRNDCNDGLLLRSTREFSGRQIVERTMRVIGVVVVPPRNGMLTGIIERAEPCWIQHSLTDAVVERFAETVI